jgi:hypothetical protein
MSIDYREHNLRAERELDTILWNDEAYERYWEMDENSSYMRAIQLAAHRDLGITGSYAAIQKDRKAIRCQANILEIGYGKRLRGLSLLTRYYKFDPRFIFGIEASEEAHEKATKAFPQSHFYLVQYDPDHLANKLKELADSGAQYHMILCRHVTQDMPNYADIFKQVYRLMFPSYRGTQKSAFIHITKSPTRFYDNPSRDLVQKELSWISAGEMAVYDAGTWADEVQKSGLVVYDAGRWYGPTHRYGYENYIFAKRGNE